ncbi:cyclic nucleotide-binding domain-containing protein [Aggregicoccus sp. 17bor-14]|uniref:cyclic nucleotide-binding domain-containing protein n=1 Tax=Myxococcaceae TaxID=31 RepID=UPI00129C2B58|nr:MULTISPECIES: cyclic nucleotide-binding domain-containing protein [Myxococcaceae]MBF5040916.1 cyclic nucleotide-binding domain-containing protein [Simulacricoccus sp. 17bor-14]MRI86704.1 cyclic nucleotide-binding domain-containing protein [Aggregicoccus sp. 17bor-14]
MDLRKVKDQAADAFTRGRFGKAAELWAQYCAGDPRDHQARLRLGDSWLKAGERERAVASYQAAAEGFARDGFLPRAIAASKLVLEQEPAHQGVQRMLADLYAARGTPADAARAARAASPPRPAVAPVQVAAAQPVAAAPVREPALAAEAGPVDLSDPLPPELALHPAGAPEGEPPAGEAPAPSSAVPPGLRPRRSNALAEPSPELEPAPREALEPQMPAGGFTELELDSDSILQAVEGAARAAAAPAAEEDEETVFSLTEEMVSDTPVPGALPHIPLFSDLPSEAFIALFERCPLRRFASGTRVLEQGSVGSAFYVVCEGQVRVLREAAGEVRELALLREGAFFGEMALLSGAPRAASVVSASDETQLLEIPAAVLSELAGAHPQVARALKKFCRERLLSNVMGSAALFQLFDRKDRRVLVERFRAREVPRGEVLVREGERSDGLYVVLSGEVEVRKQDQALARLREGELFGEMSLLHKAPATASVVAARRTSLLRLPREDFDALILSHPQILVHVAELTDDRRRHTEALLAGVVASGEEGLMLV